MVKRVKREGWRRGGYGVLLQASTRREPATSTARVSSTRVSKQTLHASPLEHLRGGETAIEALTVLSTRALAMEGAWGVTAGCSAAPGPGARLPSIPGTWRQGGEVSGGGEYPKRRGGGRRHFVAGAICAWDRIVASSTRGWQGGSRGFRTSGSRCAGSDLAILLLRQRT